jgi:hypothetical protein
MRSAAYLEHVCRGLEDCRRFALPHGRRLLQPPDRCSHPGWVVGPGPRRHHHAASDRLRVHELRARRPDVGLQSRVGSNALSASRHAKTCWYTLSTSVPSRSNTKAGPVFVAADCRTCFSWPLKRGLVRAHRNTPPIGPARGVLSLRLIGPQNDRSIQAIFSCRSINPDRKSLVPMS